MKTFKTRSLLSLLVFWLIASTSLIAQTPPYEAVPGFDYRTLYSTSVPGSNTFNEFAIWDLETMGDDLFFGMGGAHPFGGGNPWTVISRGVLGKIDNTGTVQVEGILDDEGFLDMQQLNNELVICGPDATDYVVDFRAGFNYTYSNAGGFTKYDRKHNFKKVRTAITNSGGNYSFTNLQPGYYFVRFVRPANFDVSPKVSTGPGFFCNANVWINGSGWVRRDWEEQSDAGNNDGAVSTDPLFNGYHGSFPGVYVEVSGPSAGSPDNFTNNQIDCGLRFAFGQPGDAPNYSLSLVPFTFPPSTTIGGRVWTDFNADGVMGFGEPGRANVRVELYTYNHIFPNVIHTFGVFADEAAGEAYVPCGIGSNNVPIYKYRQSTGRWSLAGNIHNANRSWRLTRLNNTWFTKQSSNSSNSCSPIPTPNQGNGTFYSTDLTNWTIIPSTNNSNYSFNFIEYRNELFHRKTSNSLEGIDDNINLQTSVIPGNFHTRGYNALANASNGCVYVGTSTGRIYKSEDMATWTYMGRVQNPASLLNPIYSLHYWEEKNALLIGTGKDFDGKIYRIDDACDHVFQCGPDFESFTLYHEQNGFFGLSLNWDALSVGNYTVYVYNHCTGVTTTFNTTNTTYNAILWGIGGCAQYDYYIEATCPLTGMTYQTNTVSVGNNCCQFQCQNLDFTARWNAANNTHVDFNWTNISGITGYELYWSPDNINWTLFQSLPSGTNYFLDTSGWRAFMLANGYNKIYFKVRALCSSGGFYESSSKILSRFSILFKDLENQDDEAPLALANRFSLTPNPSNGMTTMNIDEGIEGANISVVDISGKVVYESGVLPQDGRELSLDLRHLSAGIYMVELKNGDQSSTEKLVIE